jgi:F420H(2)-dependent biliverdin reductase
VSHDPARLSSGALAFLTDAHLGTLTTIRPDGSPHVVAIAFTYDPATRLARVITSGGSVKARNAGRPGARASLCQLEGRYWLTLEGPVRVRSDPESVRDGEQRYAQRYRVPRENPSRVVLEIAVDRILGFPPVTDAPEGGGVT